MSNNTRIIEKITSLEALQSATKTRKPSIQLPREYAEMVEIVAKAYYDAYPAQVIDKNVVGRYTSDIYNLILRRVTNLLCEEIMMGTISTAKEALGMVRTCIMPSPSEELAIIGGAKNNIEGAGIYVYAFFSQKVSVFLQKRGISTASPYYKDIFTDLQTFLFVIIDRFEPDCKNINLDEYNGDNKCTGLVSAYINRLLNNRLDCFTGHCVAPVTSSRHIIQKTRAQQKKVNGAYAQDYDEYIKARRKRESMPGAPMTVTEKYHYASNPYLLSTELSDVSSTDKDMETIGDTIEDDKALLAFDNVEYRLLYEDFFRSLENSGIDRDVATNVLQATIEYKSKPTRYQHIKLSKRERDEIANSLGITAAVYNAVLSTFVEVFA